MGRARGSEWLEASRQKKNIDVVGGIARTDPCGPSQKMVGISQAILRLKGNLWMSSFWEGTGFDLCFKRITLAAL